MINKATILKLVDYCLLNACSVNSSGLYNGKAGIALALFDVARYLQDEYINDCWWRCIAYLKSSGSNYSAEDAMAIASGYFGSNFDENSYAFSGNGYDHRTFAENYFSGSSGHMSGKILVYNTGSTSGNGTPLSHAVILKGHDAQGNFIVYDPQSGEENTVSSSISGFLVNVN